MARGRRPLHFRRIGLKSLAGAACTAFPGHPPYGGAHADVVPHLTIGQRPTATSATLRAAERELRERVPILARIDRVLLIAGSDAPQSWHTVAEIPLGRSLGR